MFPKTDTYGPPKVVDRLGLSVIAILLLYFQSSRTFTPTLRKRFQTKVRIRQT